MQIGRDTYHIYKVSLQCVNEELIHWPPGPVVATVQCQGLLVASGRQQRAGGIRASVASDDHHDIQFSAAKSDNQVIPPFGQCRQLHHFIEATIMTENVFFPRNPIIQTDCPTKFKILQYAIRLSFQCQ